MLHRHPRRFQPIPGTEPPRRGLFVKRWGTLLALPERRPCAHLRDACFTPGALEALFRATQAGWVLYLIGNEDDVAFGRLGDDAWKAFERELLEHLGGLGIDVRRCYASLDHPEGKGRHRRRSVFHLPDTGLFFHASQEDDVVLSESWVVGDATLELAAGERAGCRVASVRTGRAVSDGELLVEPELWGDDLAEVVDALTSALQRARP